ncbi:11275_t:CDS:2 [Entrophospora sp. SA101]|nr:11275_t:CDS:2 [Entrophospora sp. SA101]
MLIVCLFSSALSRNDLEFEYELKFMDIDQENLSIPETVYDAIVSLPSAKFQKVCHDMTVTGKTVMKLDSLQM